MEGPLSSPRERTTDDSGIAASPPLESRSLARLFHQTPNVNDISRAPRMSSLALPPAPSPSSPSQWSSPTNDCVANLNLRSIFFANRCHSLPTSPSRASTTSRPGGTDTSERGEEQLAPVTVSNFSAIPADSAEATQQSSTTHSSPIDQFKADESTRSRDGIPAPPNFNNTPSNTPLHNAFLSSAPLPGTPTFAFLDLRKEGASSETPSHHRNSLRAQCSTCAIIGSALIMSIGLFTGIISMKSPHGIPVQRYYKAISAGCVVLAVYRYLK